MAGSHIFGTDGVRAHINTGAMTAETITRIALATGQYFLNQRDSAKLERRPLVVIGKDTRLSGYMIEAALQAGFASIGMDTRLIGPLPTPGVANLTRTLRADLGVMISASHNPHHDNGIKLFGPDGYKLPDEAEAEISRIMGGHIPLAEAAHLGRALRMEDGLGRYVETVKSAIPRRMRFEGLKIVVDCANGAAYRAAPDVFFELGAEVIPIGVDPDGMNINEGCGAVHPEVMAETVLAHDADLGLALDGDADRLILADEKGGILNGDQCLAVIADSMAARDRLAGGTVVGTLMTNHGLAQYLETRNITLERTHVGDRYIVERMRSGGFNLGGEPSGHILMTDHATSGDAIMAALKMLLALKESDKPASESLRKFTALPQRIINIKSGDREKMLKILSSSKAQSLVSDAENQLNGEGRVVIRPSGTEPLVRVMVEATDDAVMNKTCENVAKQIEQLLVSK